jgi:hypothetical protein
VVAARHATVLLHQVQAEGRTLEHAVELAIEVGRHAHALAAGEAHAGIAEAVGLRGLGHEVHVAGGGAAADIGAGRALEDLDRLDVEGVAADGTEVADAVDEDAALRIEAAHEDRVTGRGVAVLAGKHGDARCVLQRLAQGDGALLLQHFLLDDGDGLRRV